MMTNFMIFRLIVLWIFILAASIVQASSLPSDSVDPLGEISARFPDSIRLTTNGKQNIEFCPDNTCDLFTATKNIPLENLKDFAYLYIYFFSDYYVLQDWRYLQEPASIARNILLKPSYQLCKRDRAEKTARCLLRHLSRKWHIQLYAVRYDENVRSVLRMNLSKATAKARLKRD